MVTQLYQKRARILCCWILVFIGVVFSACSKQQSAEVEQGAVTITPESDNESLQTLTATTTQGLPTKPATLQPTQTDLPLTWTNTPSATPPLQPVVDVTVKYVTRLDEFPALNGKLAFSKIGLSSLAYLVDLSTNEELLLGDPDWEFSLINAISPDRENIVVEDDKYQNYLADTNGNISQQIKRVSPSSGIYDWLDNDRLIVLDDWDGKQFYGLPSLTILLNPDTLETTILEPEYPNFEITRSWGNFGLAIYHPRFPIVVYPAHNKQKTSLVLFDMEKQESLAEFPAVIERTHTPQWSPNGIYLLLVGNFGDGKKGKDQEIYLVNPDGKIAFRTLFANHIPREEFERFSWSPNSQKISFWIRVFNSKEEQLAVLDVSSGNVTQYNLFSKSGWSGPPVWSPDSQFIAVEQTSDADDHKITVLQLDSGLAYEYLETDIDQVLEGWVK